MKAAYYTLGCKLNYAETSTIGRMLQAQGIEKANGNDSPDIYIVNTCSVTAAADKKCRQLIHRLHRENPQAAIVVTGCYAQLNVAEVAAMPGVSIVLGAAEKLRADQFVQQWLRSRQPCLAAAPTTQLRQFEHSCERGDRTRYFLKVQDGCDNFCSYCTIPMARGRSRSGKIDDLVERAKHAADLGGREIVITGVNIGDFGRHDGRTLPDLIKALDRVQGIERYRISSIEPDLLTDQIIEAVADSRAFMPHFHIPLQCGSDNVLKLMRRRYDTSLFARRIDTIRACMPDAFIGVDIIVGARGENLDEWQRSYDYIEALDVTRLHVFPYSERPGTTALLLDGAVDPAEKQRRVAELTDLSERKLQAFMLRQQGTIRPVLWEQLHRGHMQGFTDNYIRVIAPEGEIYTPNTITYVRLGEISGETMTAVHPDL